MHSLFLTKMQKRSLIRPIMRRISIFTDTPLRGRSRQRLRRPSRLFLIRIKRMRRLFLQLAKKRRHSTTPPQMNKEERLWKIRNLI